MDKRTILTSLWVVPLVSAILLFFVWRLSGHQAAPQRPAAREASGPPRITLPRSFFTGLRRSSQALPFRWIVIYRGGDKGEKGWEKALERFDLVLAAQEPGSLEPWVRWGRPWFHRKEKVGGQGVFHLAWLGRADARLRACLVRVLEVLVSALRLPAEAVRLREELPWAALSGGTAGGADPLVGVRIRSWIRGAGPGQPRKGR
ncbi:MAG TPA: hypothetical protein ENJ97_03220 [Planctomycetes bacterium]|nr:hypothetical protein [Planctomycetota bacterium]